MCIITFQIKEHPLYKLIVIANRDESYNRPTASAHFWEEEPDLFAGRDLEANGTWMGITKQGRLAALTNHRNPATISDARISRGQLVADFLKSHEPAWPFITNVQQQRECYNGFNLIAGTVDNLYFYSQQENEMRQLEAGTHSVSNASLNTPWPKVVKARQRLRDYVTANHQIDVEVLFEQLADDTPARASELPDTGVGAALEKQLSPVFIRTEHYGTRSSTVLLVTYENEVTFMERTFHKGKRGSTIREQFQLQ